MIEDNKEAKNELPAEEIEVVVDDDSEDSLSADAEKGGGNKGSEPEGQKASPEAGSSSEDDELADYSDGVKKRIAKLTGKMREAERREKAALEYAQALKVQLDSEATKSKQLESSHLVEYKSRLDHQDAVLKIAMREAIERGDTDKQVEIQSALAQFAAERHRFAQLDASRKVQEERAAQQPAAQQPAQIQPNTRPDPKAEAWADLNKWVGSDEPMTLTAFSNHKSLVEREGYDPSSEDYYRELDRRIRTEFPHKFQPEQRKPNVVAPANGRSASGSPSKTQIKLSPSQVAIAKKLGVSLEQYARQVAALQKNS
jgi:roadblock/LC7 domain-containing protein